jgi:hypothetical protein
MIKINSLFLFVFIFALQFQLFSQQDLETSIHKYQVVQAWNLVRNQHPEVINSEMQNRMQFTPETYGDWNNSAYNGQFPWEVGKILTGAFREDVEDVVWQYGRLKYLFWGCENCAVTTTHFWLTDCTENGGDTWQYETPCGTNFHFENSFIKARALWNGTYFKDGYTAGALTIGPFLSNNFNPTWFKIKYNGLQNAYRNQNSILITHITHTSPTDPDTEWDQQFTEPPLVNYFINNTIFNDTNQIRMFLNNVIWETVGRICHLIGDMSVPAHAHGSTHEFDTYETWYIPNYYNYFNSYAAELQANRLNQPLIIDLNNSYDPIRKVLYLTNQAADRFAGNSYLAPHTFCGGISFCVAPGNLNYSKYYVYDNYDKILKPYYNSISTTTHPSEIDPDYCYSVGINSMVFSFRTTAGFLWYVYNQFFGEGNQNPCIIHMIDPCGTTENINPVILGQNYPYTFQCHFKILRNEENRPFNYVLRFKQDGIVKNIYQGTANLTSPGVYDVYAPCEINSTNGPCLNRPAELIVDAYISGESTIYHNSATFIPYKNNDLNCNGNLKSVTNLECVEIGTYNNVRFLKPCRPEFGPGHQVKLWKVYKNIEKSPSEDVFLDLDYSIGYEPNVIFNSQNTWAGIETFNNETRLYTYIFEVIDMGISLPCQKEKAAIVYHKTSNLPPVISCFSPNPPVIYGTAGNIYCVLSQGGTIQCDYYWDPVDKPSNMTFSNVTYDPQTGYLKSNNNQNFITINWPFSKSNILQNQFYLRCMVHNAYGWSSVVTTGFIIHSSNSGCPWLLVQGSDSVYQEDNNLLNRSKFQENIGVDISDRYVLGKAPGMINDLYTFSIEETANDTSFINNIKLYEVTHPVGTILCVTEDNQLAIFDSASVISVNYADINGKEITEDVQFHISPKGTAQSDTLDHTYADFPSNSNGNAVIANLKFKQYQQQTQKDWVATINISYDDESYTTNMARRENKSITAIPIINGNVNITNVNIDWYKGNDIRYIAIANLNYEGFSVTELPLYSAINSYNEEEMGNLVNLDSLYSIVEPSKSLVFKFYRFGTLINSSSQNKKDYVIEVNGRIGSYNNNSKNSKLKNRFLKDKENILVSYKNKLNNNYPNPFNPITKISYSIEKAGLVKLKIYDILGREIKTLVNEIKNPGEYIAEFNGSSLSSGVYFYRIECNGFIAIKKMVLIK